MKYRGWVPTVTGNLAFSVLGHTSHPTESLVNRCGKHLNIMQSRDLLDLVLPYAENSNVGRYFREYFANKVIGISGKFCFVCVSDYDSDNNVLSGNIYLLAHKESKAKIQELKNKFKQAIEPEEIFDFVAFCRGVAEKTCIACAEFQVTRNGCFDIVTSDQPQNAMEDNEVDEIVANQMFFFFKDASHVHQHHDPSYDNITSLTPLSEGNHASWIQDTRSALYRSVIRYKRFRSERALFRASGILAYAEAFDKCHPESSDERIEFHGDQLENSLRVSREEIQHFDQKKIASIETGRNFFFAAFGFIISASFLARLDPNISVNVHPAISTGTIWAAQYPLHVLSFLILFSYGYAFWTHKKDPSDIGVVRNLLQWFQGFRMRWYFIANMFVTIGLAILCYILLSFDLSPP